MIFVEAVEQRAITQAVTIDDLIEDYFEDVYRFASRRLSKEDAEDATLETFQAAIGQLHRIRGTQPLLWLFGIARRKVVDHRRSLVRRKEEPLRAEIPTRQSDTLDRREADAKLRQIVESLSDDQRDALLLQHLEGLTVSQIAVVLNRSESAVTGLLYRARNAAYEKGKSYFAASEVNL
ncbi:MAG: RNA polymerase sigma factor [Fimbriimonas sp.]|nr:RNA polymerase sigma factor [Fimbriimonas sp.]